ncbi:DUF6086 family protein [Actinoplanes sp. NPDC049596]|uniref:DUF6086 family protein n=1 Tax=unclassified Actinoplanes TaxID=2626549 RepID=UPI00343DB4BD
MTYVFFVDDAEGRTVWSPVSTAGALFTGMVKVVADVDDVPTGLTARADDLHAIDPERFEAFVRRGLSAYASTNHGKIRLALEGVLPTATVLLERCGRPLSPQHDEERTIMQRGQTLGMVW